MYLRDLEQNPEDDSPIPFESQSEKDEPGMVASAEEIRVEGTIAMTPLADEFFGDGDEERGEELSAGI